MDARAKSVREILHSGIQYLIPFFQRHYSWLREDWERLRADLWTLLEDENATSQHFLGPLVCTPVRQIPGEIPAYQLIDGQQRLTTLTLLLSATRDVAREHGLDDLAEEIEEDYLIHKRKKAIQRYKVVPRIGDREVLFAVIDGQLEKQHRTASVTRARNFYQERIADWAAEDAANRLRRLFVAVAERLSLVVITIEGENPYEIFESLNSTGQPLEESDLIRNFLFMQVPIEGQEEFNVEHWDQFEKMFGKEGDSTAKFQTQFYRTYLMRNGKHSRPKFTFVDFKEQYRQRSPSPAEQVSELKRFARYELSFRQLAICDNGKLKAKFREVVMLDISTAHPLLMNLMDRFEAEQIDEDTLLGCIQDLASFVLRRSICGESTRSYGRWFCEAISAISAIDSDPREDLRRYWLRRGWPNDATFLNRIVEFPIYHRERKKCRLILERLEESYGHKEKVDADTLTIEHVLPQEIDKGKSGKAWKEMLGDAWQAAHGRWLHTLGNLTLSGYNPDLGNKPYPIKRAELAKSNLVLNRHFEHVPVWDEDAIQTRGERLAKEVATLWPRPAGGAYSPPVDEEPHEISSAERRQKNLAYWTDFVALAQEESGLPKLPKPSRRPLVGCPIGRSGFRLLAVANLKRRYVGVTLACRGPNRAENFGLLRSDLAMIESEIGEKLLWQESSGSSSQIALRLSDADPGDEADQRRQHEWLVARMRQFFAVFGKRCKLLGRDEADLEKRQLRRYRFWEALLQRAAERTSLHSGKSPNRDGWTSTGAGRRGLSYAYVIGQHNGRVELYIDRGKGRKAETKQIFDSLHDHKGEIEAIFGAELTWERIDNRRACRIAYPFSTGGYRDDEQEWPTIQDQMIDAMIRLEQALAPQIAELKADS